MGKVYSANLLIGEAERAQLPHAPPVSSGAILTAVRRDPDVGDDAGQSAAVEIASIAAAGADVAPDLLRYKPRAASVGELNTADL